MKKTFLLILILSSVSFAGIAQDEIWMRPNQGQWHENISYKIEVPAGELFLEEKGFTYSFSTEGEHYDHGHNHGDEEFEGHQHVVKTYFLEAKTPTFTTSGESSFTENYFLTNDPSKWVTNSHAYEEVVYQNLYTGIDLKMYQHNYTLKYDIIVNPGGDPSDYQVRYEGQDKLSIIDGALHVVTTLGTLVEEAPIAFQTIAGVRQKVACEYALDGNILSFAFPEGYNNTLPLIIDPELNFSSFTGASSDNWGMTACPDIDGKLIGGGIVSGPSYPTTAGAFDDTHGGGWDVGITKFTEDGSGIVFSTFLGGGGGETPHSIIVNDANELYVMGATSSSDFPVGGDPFDGTHNGGAFGTSVNGIAFGSGTDIFVVKLAPAGNAILGGTFLGGTDNDGLSQAGDFSLSVVHNYGDQLRGEVMVDDASNVYIASTTNSSNFPIVGGFDASLGGDQDAVVVKLNSNLSSVLWSSYVGGSALESGNSINVSSTGDLFVAGGTTSSNFPGTAGKLNATYQGGTVDGYVLKLAAPGYTTPQATYLGTNDYDQAYFVQLDIDDFVYVYGQSSGNYSTLGDNYINANSGQFIHKLSNDLTTAEWSSVFGASSGVAEISPTAFLVSDCYEIYVAGWGGETNIADGSTTSGFPVTGDAYSATTAGSNFWLGVFSQDMEDLKYASFMGDPGSSGDHVDGGTSRFDKSGTIYHAVCAACFSSGGEFPTTPGAFAVDKGGSANCNMAVFQFELSQIDASLGTGSPVICIPDPVLFENDSENGDSFFWDFGDGNTSTDFEPTHFYTDPGVYEVMLVVSDAAGCYTPDTAYVEVTIAVFEGEAGTLSDTICPGSSVQLFAIGGETYTWGPADVLDDPSSAEPIATIDEETTFTVTIESVCGSTEVEVTVYVYGTDATATGDTAICVGGSAILGAEGGDTYLWSPPEDLDDPESPTPSASPPLTTYYEVEITTEEGCLIYDTVKVHVDLDVPYPNLIDEVTICQGDTIRITAGGATDYLWTPDYNISDVTLYNPFVWPEIDTSYAVTFTNACGSTYDTVDVNVIQIEATIVGDTTICPGGTATLWASGGKFYSWSPSGYLTHPNDSMTQANPPYPDVFTVIISDEFGCSTTASTEVFFHDVPEIDVTPEVYAIIGDTVTISATADGDILWTPPYNIACTTCSTTEVFPQQKTVYTATVTDANGCTNTAAVPVYFDPLIFVPNAFTPDGDNFNNTFRAIAHNIDEFEMLIFNRWGEVVYRMETLDDEWDASYNGSLVPDDVYVWQIVYSDLDGIEYELRGHVTVLK